jgi:hypothetical protein
MAVFSPLAVAALVVAAVSLIGIIVNTVKRSRTFAGYEEIAADSARIAASLAGSESFRDGHDLLVSGNRDGIPLVVRFSNSEASPGLNIRCGAPVDFLLTFSAEDDPHRDGHLLRSGNPQVDSRCTTRTDDPIQAKLFLSSAETQKQIGNLCGSGTSFLTLSPGKIELSEALIPVATADHVLRCLNSLVALSKQAAKMPGSYRTRVEPIRHERSSWLLRAALVIGVIVAVGTVVSNQARLSKAEGADPGVRPDGLSREEVNVIPDAKQWRVADPAEFSSDFTAWMQRSGASPASKIELAPDEKGLPSSVAYLFVTEKTPDVKRVVWVVDRQVLCDVVDKIEGIAKVPKQSMSRIAWSESSTPVETAEGDGLLVVRDYGDATTATVFFVNNGKLYSGIPADFHNVDLR